MKIDVLHIDDCPNWETAGRLVGEVLSELDRADVIIRFTLIRSPADAARVAFAGSPTILIDGVDIVADANPTTDLACRIYRDDGHFAGLPSRDTVRRAILSHIA